MLILRKLCRWFPSLRWFFVGIGYLMLFIGGEVWFFCFPLTAYTLHVAHEFPLAYFGVFEASDPGFNYWISESMRGPIGGLCAAFAFAGMFAIYFNVRNLRRLRRGEY